MRLFTAVECPGDVKDRLLEAQRQAIGLGGMKPVEYDNLHLTLKFLGEVDGLKADKVKEALGSVKHGRFEVRLKGLGVFPNPGYVRVVWAGVEAGFKEVVELEGEIDSALKPLGFEADVRFHPHVTLARVKGAVDKEGLRRLLDSGRDVEFGSYTAGGFKLMESKLTPKGPVYSAVRDYLLK